MCRPVPLPPLQALTDSLASCCCASDSLLAWVDVESIDTSLSQQILQSFHDPQKMEIMSSTDRAKTWNECKVRWRSRRE